MLMKVGYFISRMFSYTQSISPAAECISYARHQTYALPATPLFSNTFRQPIPMCLEDAVTAISYAHFAIPLIMGSAKNAPAM
jgi:hypothetical protein